MYLQQDSITIKQWMWQRKRFGKKGEALLGHFSSNRQECSELLADMMVEFLHPMEG